MLDPVPIRREVHRLQPRRKAGGIAYRDHGAGEAIFLIHGVGLNADAWEPQIEALAANHRVIAIDMAGHGESEPLAGGATLAHYVAQVDELLMTLGIAAATIIGHSMGGLVAIGFALAHPGKTLRLGVLNSVYMRSPDKRAAAMRRAAEVKALGSTGDTRETMERWFGTSSSRSATASLVEGWLRRVNPAGYAAAYAVFAASDEAFAGRLHELRMPALFATGSRDANSTADMAARMAKEAGQGERFVLEGARHMMSLTHAPHVNAALLNLLKRPASRIDPLDLRRAFGAFMTGVTVVTTKDRDGLLRGFTANSFSSVSLDPPLLLVCLAKASASRETFARGPGFAVNILAESQKEISGVFASKRLNKFEGVDWTPSASGLPLLSGAVAWFDCALHQIVDAGDHVVLIGRVLDYGHTDANPLGYARGGYFSLGLEQSAVNAVSKSGRTEVGAILEADGRLLVIRDRATGRLSLPLVGEAGRPGSASQLLAMLEDRGVKAKLGFLYAVFENAETLTQSIYYRGEAEAFADSAADSIGFDAMPWDDFEDQAVVSMLRRYAHERVQGRYGIYSGGHETGETKELSDR
jgi:(E)-2-((N-methylformamido)methylene)succinate hydrolase